MIGKAIEHFREKNRMSKTELSEAANISLSSITQYEKGNRNPSPDALESLAKALNINVSDLEEMSAKIKESFKNTSIIDDYMFQKHLDFISRNNDAVIELTDLLMIGINIRVHDIVSELSEQNKLNRVSVSPIRRRKNTSTIESLTANAIKGFLLENLNEISNRIQDEYQKTGLTVEDIIDNIRDNGNH